MTRSLSSFDNKLNIYFFKSPKNDLLTFNNWPKLKMFLLSFKTSTQSSEHYMSVIPNTF